MDKVRWNPFKNVHLKQTRGITFEQIIKGKVVDEIMHPTKLNQKIFIIDYQQYLWAVPFVIEKEGNIFLKTIYPSRKLTKKYKGGSCEKD